MALKNLKNIVTDLGSKYQGANQGPACCGSKASWENVFGGGSSGPPGPCCGDLSQNPPNFGTNKVSEFDPRLGSFQWQCPPTDCPVTLSFYAQASNLVNDPTSFIVATITGPGIYPPVNLTWNSWTNITINPGDSIFFTFYHSVSICNNATIRAKNITCNFDFGVVCNLIFGDPACYFCPAWDLRSIVSQTTNAVSPVYVNTTTQVQTISFLGDLFVGGSPGQQVWVTLNGSFAFYLCNPGSTGIQFLDVPIGAEVRIRMQALDLKCYGAQITMNNITCGYNIGTIGQMQVNSGNC